MTMRTVKGVFFGVNDTYPEIPVLVACDIPNCFFEMPPGSVVSRYCNIGDVTDDGYSWDIGEIVLVPGLVPWLKANDTDQTIDVCPTGFCLPNGRSHWPTAEREAYERWQSAEQQS